MAVKLQDLAKEFGISVSEVRDYIDLLDLKVPKSAQDIKDDIADVLREEIKKDLGDQAPEELEEKKEESVAEIYDEIIAEEKEREIRKSVKKIKGAKGQKKVARKKAEKKEVIESLGATSEQKTVAGTVKIGRTISVKEFAEKTGIPVAKVIGELMKNGILATINQMIDYETASIVATNFKIKLNQKHEEASTEQLMEGDLSELLKESNTENLVERPPVIVIMGHVDHGKTKLLDAIRETDVVATESGGITQHIGAYQVSYNGKKITFLDTPGHAAFTEMRARGARVTDIAVLVVAADEGVKPQTKEAYDHAKSAKVPIIVAINKMDKEGADPERVMRELAELGLQPEAWGGDTIMIPLSAMTKEGIDKLLESLLLVAEMQDLKANPYRPAIGTVIESNLDPSLGPIATVVINTGSLSIGNPVVIGTSYGKMKRMMDYKGAEVKKVGPSGAVRIAGLSEVPKTGDILIVTENEKVARDKAIQIQTILKSQKFHSNSMSEIINRIQSGLLKVLKVVLKADTQGSLEAITGALNKIPSDKIRVQVIHSGVGHITANDINMAGASMGVVMGFHVTIPKQVENVCRSTGVEVRTYTIIYNLIDDVKNILEGLLDPEVIEIDLGEAEVLQIFLTTKKEMIVGCKVNSGKIENNVMLRVVRDDKEIGSGSVTNLKKVDKAVKEVKEGHECGIRFHGDVKPEVGDKFFAYKKESKKRTL